MVNLFSPCAIVLAGLRPRQPLVGALLVVARREGPVPPQNVGKHDACPYVMRKLSDYFKKNRATSHWTEHLSLCSR